MILKEAGAIVAVLFPSAGGRGRGDVAWVYSRWRGYVAQEYGAEFSEGFHRGANTWADEDACQAYTLTGDWLVYSADGVRLRGVLDRIEGVDAGSLSDDASFTAVRATAPELPSAAGVPQFPPDMARARFGGLGAQSASTDAKRAPQGAVRVKVFSGKRNRLRHRGR